MYSNVYSFLPYDGIGYECLLDDHYYQPECFDTNEMCEILADESLKRCHFVKSKQMLPGKFAESIEAMDMREKCGMAIRNSVHTPVERSANAGVLRFVANIVKEIYCHSHIKRSMYQKCCRRNLMLYHLPLCRP